MAGITLEIAETKLALWLDAESTLATSQQYEIQTGTGSSRMLRRADLAEVREQVKFWDAKVNSLTTAAAGGRRRVRYIVPE